MRRFILAGLDPSTITDRYWIGGTGNWSDTAHWACFSGGTGGNSVPSSSNDVYFDALSGTGTATIDATATAKTLTCTGYTGTLTLGANLTVSGNITLVAGMTFTPSTYTVTVGGTNSTTSTITSGGKAFYNFTFIGLSSSDFVLTDDLTVNHTLTLDNSAGNLFIESTHNIIAKGDVITENVGNNITPSVSAFTLVFAGTSPQNFTIGTWRSGGFAWQGNIVFNSSSTVTISGTLTYYYGTITYTAGTIDTSTNTTTLNLVGACTLNTNGMSWYNVTFNVYGAAVTLSSNCTVTGTLTNLSYCYVVGAYNLIAQGDIVCSGSQSLGYGGTSTATLVIGGGADQSITLESNPSYPQFINIDINKSGGTATFTNTIHRIGLSLTKTAGNVDFTTDTPTISYYYGTHLLGATFYNLTLIGAGNIGIACTLDGDVTVNHNLVNYGYPKLLTHTLYLKGDLDNSAGGSFWTASTTILNISGTGTQAIDLRSDPSYPHDIPIVISNSGTVNFGNYTHRLRNNLNFNGTGTYNLAGTINFQTGTLTYTAGTVVPGTSTLDLRDTQTIAGNLPLYNFTLEAGTTTHLTSTNTVTVGGTFNAQGTAGSPITLDATTPTSRALLPVTTLGTVSYVTSTDIDSSGGVWVIDTNGTLSNTIHWSTLPVSLFDPLLISAD